MTSNGYTVDIGWLSEHLTDVESIIRGIGGIGTSAWFDYDAALMEGNVQGMLNALNTIHENTGGIISLTDTGIKLDQCFHLIDNTVNIPSFQPVDTDRIWYECTRRLDKDDMNKLIDVIDALNNMHAYDDIDGIIAYIMNKPVIHHYEKNRLIHDMRL